MHVNALSKRVQVMVPLVWKSFSRWKGVDCLFVLLRHCCVMLLCFVRCGHCLLGQLRGWQNTVGSLIELNGLNNNYHRPQVTGICVNNRGMHFHRIRHVK